VDPQLTAREQLRLVRDVDLQSLAHDDVPYDAIARAVSTDGPTGGDPLISVLLVHQEALGELGSGTMAASGLHVEVMGESNTLVAAKYDLEVVLSDVADGQLDVGMVHGPGVSRKLAAAILSGFCAALAALAHRPDERFPQPTDLIEASSIPDTARPASEASRSQATSPADPDRELEELVISAFGDVIGWDSGVIDRDANFFDLGGTSLAATRVVSAVADEVGGSVPVRWLFEAPTPALLAAQLNRATDRTIDVLPPLTGDGSPPDIGPAPLSPAQQRLWLVHKMMPELALYPVPVVVAIPPGIGTEQLAAAWRAVCQRHAPLRTFYPEIDGVPYQAVQSNWRGPLPDYGDGDATEAIGILLSTPFDLQHTPPVRVGIVGSAEHRLLVVVTHHIAMDGESVAVLQRDLTAAIAGEQLAPLPVEYSHVARWQQLVNSRTRAEQLEYWSETLRGYSGVLELPECAERLPTRSLDTATVSVALGDSSDAVRRTAARLGVSEFHVHHAALALALSMVCGTDDVAIGTAVSLRRHPETLDMVGMFVSTVALRTILTSGMTTDDLVEYVRRVDLDALDRALLPFEDVVTQHDPVREVGRHPIVQVMLAVIDGSGAAVPEELSPDSEFDLQLTVGRSDALFTYATALYDKQVVETFAVRWRIALDLLTSGNSTALSAVDLRSPEERASEQISADDSATSVTLGDLFRNAAVRYPDETAIDDGVSTVSYRELDQWSAEMAGRLTDAGLRAGQTVAMLLPRSIESVVALWAVVRIGAVYAPIDPRYPADRVARMLALSDAAGMITEQAQVEAGIATDTVQVSVPPRPTADVRSRQWRIVGVDRPAYLLFTSGTTGTPNAVAVTHRGLSNLLDPKLFIGGPRERIAHVASPSFDASILETIWAFGTGATLAVVSPDNVGGHLFTENLAQLGVTQMFLTPSVLATLDGDKLPTLHTLYVGGEPCPPFLVENWSTHRRMVNGYGPTETTIFATAHAPMRADAPHVIGKPFSGMRGHILDKYLRVAPEGTVGELYLSGPALAMGYHDNGSLTASRFVAAASGERMYRTGDLVRRNHNGDLEYLGRSDRQVKIRGQRIEPAEVDAVLVAAGADTALTVLRPGPAGPALVAYVVVPEGDSLPVSDLWDAAVKGLPRHMVPAAIVQVADLPRTPVGKWDLSALPEPAWTVVGGEPRNPTEATVVDVFRTALDIPEIGIYDDFFEMGGNSLLLATVSGKLAARLGRPVPVAILFANPTPAALSGALDRAAELTEDLGAAIELSAGSGDAPVLWCVHPVSGVAADYRPLGRHLDLRVMGLQMPGLDDAAAPHYSSLEEVAARHIRTIKHYQPEGPYNLLGWSLGGSLAHEMARQMTAAGDGVDALVLLDPRLEIGEQAAGFDGVDAASLRALDPARFDQYRLRVEEMIFAAKAHRPGRVRAAHTVFVAAQDNMNPDEWVPFVAGPMEIELVEVPHHSMGDPEAMAMIAGLVRRIFDDGDQHETAGPEPYMLDTDIGSAT
jgi:amino acid adenylation domain-containing protein